MKTPRYGEPALGKEDEGYSTGGRKRRRRGGIASGPIAQPRLDQRSRRTANGAPKSADLPAPAGDQGAPLPGPAVGTRPSTPLSIDDDDRGIGMKRGGKLTTAERHALPTGDFALPGRGTGPGGTGSGSYPIPDRGHAISALSRASAKATPAEQRTIRAAVRRKFPGISQQGD